MAFYFGVEQLTLTDGTELQPPKDGMTVFFGPNNSGKSVLLNELAILLRTYPGTIHPARWVERLTPTSEGTADEFLAWLTERGYEERRDLAGNVFLPGDSQNQGSKITKDQVRTYWTGNAFGSMNWYLTKHMTTQLRLNNDTQAQLLPFRETANHPVQHLAASEKAHQEFSALVKRAFKSGIALNRYEPLLRLQTGETGMPDEKPPVSDALREAYEALPMVSEQGDGLRSFVHILLTALVRPCPVVIIDEPEAFLHPPQARLLGRFLAENPPSPCQVFVATHSSDFLNGVLEASKKPVSLVRLSRPGGKPTADVLPATAVSEILDTPVLRYSNIISGLFHDGVVLAEAEGDCQFYAASFDVSQTGPNSNVTFLHTNGKSRLAETASQLRKCGLPTAIVADLDFLRERGMFKAAIGRLGGIWAEIEDDFAILESEVNSARTSKTAQQIKNEINDIIGSPRATDLLEQSQAERITVLLKSTNLWGQVKRSGLTALSGTTAYQSMEHLIAYCAKLGLFLVPVGELECWIPAVSSSNKKNWLNAVFDQNHYRNPTNQLQEFCSEIMEYLIPEMDS